MIVCLQQSELVNTLRFSKFTCVNSAQMIGRVFELQFGFRNHQLLFNKLLFFLTPNSCEKYVLIVLDKQVSF